MPLRCCCRADCRPREWASPGGRQLQLNAYSQIDRGSASLIYDATALHASPAGGWRSAGHTVLVNGDEARFHYVQVGISRRWFSPGTTTPYVDRGLYRSFNVGEILSISPGTSKEAAWRALVDPEVRRWGPGIEQAVDVASWQRCVVGARVPVLRGSSDGQL